MNHHHQKDQQAHQLEKQYFLHKVYYNRLSRFFSRPHLLSWQSASLPPWLTVSFPNGTQHQSSIAHLSLDNCQPFFWKDCMIYINITSPQGRTPTPTYTDMTDHQRILDAVYRSWFPTRDRRHDGFHDRENFFASLVCCCPTKEQPYTNLAQIKTFHRMLCTQLEVNNTLVQSAAENPSEGSSFPVTFEKVFIMIDRLDWEFEGVLLVQSTTWSPRDVAYLDESLPKSVTEQPYGDGVWRVTLADAIKAITRLSGDEQRMISVRDESGFFEEQFENEQQSFTWDDMDYV